MCRQTTSTNPNNKHASEYVFIIAALFLKIAFYQKVHRNLARLLQE